VRLTRRGYGRRGILDRARRGCACTCSSVHLDALLWRCRCARERPVRRPRESGTSRSMPSAGTQLGHSRPWSSAGRMSPTSSASTTSPSSAHRPRGA